MIFNVSVNLLGLLGLYITLRKKPLQQKRLTKDCCKLTCYAQQCITCRPVSVLFFLFKKKNINTESTLQTFKTSSALQTFRTLLRASIITFVNHLILSEIMYAVKKDIFGLPRYNDIFGYFYIVISRVSI